MHTPDVENPCGFCKQKNSRALYPIYDTFINHFHINQCNNCNAYFLSPPPNEELLSLAYDESYYGEGKKKFNESLIERMLDYFREKKAYLVNKHLKGTGNILDIGCGNGRFLSFVKARGNYEIFGIETKGRSAERAAKIPGINLKTGTLDNDDFESESLDAITLFHVFEHLTEPVKTEYEC